MRCRQISAILSDSTHCELGAARRVGLEAHLVCCADCASAWSAHQALIRQRIPAIPVRLFGTARAIAANGQGSL